MRAPRTPSAFRSLALTPVVVLCALASGCPSPPANGDDAGPGGDDAGPGAPDFDQPEVISFGGPVLTDPKVIAVYYSDDATNPPRVDPVLPQLQTSGYWEATTAEYGVGALSVLPSITLAIPAPATTTYDGIANAIDAEVATGDPSAIYMMVVPDGTVVNDSGQCCVDFDGEHATAQIGGATVAMALVCSCPGFDGPNINDDDQLSVVVSHELVEAATDPFDDPAYAQTDDDHIAWTLESGGEVADLCALLDEFALSVGDIDHAVQRSWSNAAAAAGQDPCVPPPDGEVYFNSTPQLTDALDVTDFFGDPVTTRGKRIAVGESATIDVKLGSAGPVAGPWTVTAVDAGELDSGEPRLSFSWDSDTGNNGDTLHLTITVISVNPDVGADVFLLQSVLGNTESLSLGMVGP